MNTRISRILFGTTIAGAIALLLLAVPVPMPAHAGGVVTNCTESGLDAALDGGGTVTFNCNGNNSPATINITSQKTISFTTTIDGSNGGNTVTIGSIITPTRIFSVTSGTALTLTNLIVQSGYELNGGCIYANGALALNQVQITNCTATGNGGGKGGAIFVNSSGSAILINTSILTNTAGALGAGIYDNGMLSVTNSYVSGNSTVGNGAGIYIDFGASPAMLTNTILSGNATFSSGGAIFNYSTLTVNNSTLSGNSTGNLGGGIYNFSTLIVNDSTFSGNFAINFDGGGGIYNSSTMTVNNTILSGNTAAKGGGITNSGNATLTSVTLSGNTVTSIGGGIYNGAGTLTLNKSTVSGNSATNFGGAGGGIFSFSILTVTNSTISGNSATNSGHGGGIDTGGVANLTDVTLSGNNANLGGGILSEGSFTLTVTLMNTILAQGSVGGNCYKAGGAPIESNGYNLSSDGSCTTYLNQTGDLNNTNPQLGPLSNNGGPTLMHALLPGSPAIDRIPFGTNGCGTTIPTDQRGAHRPIGATCDVGAYEAGYLFLPLILR